MMTDPTYAEALGLPCGPVLRVTADRLDSNGHMNVRHYMAIFDDAGTPALLDHGLPREWLAAHRRGVMDLSHHVRYLHEVMEDDDVSVHVRFLGRSSKAVHWMCFMLNRTRSELAATLELLTIHVDLDARRATAWSEQAASALDIAIARDANRTWAAPVSGCIGVRSG